MPGARLTVALVALTLAGCAADSGTGGRQVEGNSFSAITSSLFSTAQTGSAPGSVTGSVGATPAGGILSGPVGASLDDRDRRRAAAAEKQALEWGQPGEPVGWRGGAGRHGTIVPGVDYEIRGIRCRDYTHSIYIDRRPQTARITACRNPDATWSPMALGSSTGS
jgi:surface antigen